MKETLNPSRVTPNVPGLCISVYRCKVCLPLYMLPVGCHIIGTNFRRFSIISLGNCWLMPASLSFSFPAFFQTIWLRSVEFSSGHIIPFYGPLQFYVPGGVHDFQIVFNEFQHFVNAIIVCLAPRLGNLVKNEIVSHATALHIKHFGLKFT